MVDRLARCGQRSVTALVDISNYVMFEYGRPSHIFDLDKIHGGLTVRWGRAGRSSSSCSTATPSGRRPGRRDRRRQAGRIAGRHHGRRRHRGVRRHAQRLRRGRVLVARGGGGPLAPLQLRHRRRAPLRARRRPGADRRAHRAHHAADPRHLRRRAGPDGRPGAQPAEGRAGAAARRARRKVIGMPVTQAQCAACCRAWACSSPARRGRRHRDAAVVALRPRDRGRPDRGSRASSATTALPDTPPLAPVTRRSAPKPIARPAVRVRHALAGSATRRPSASASSRNAGESELAWQRRPDPRAQPDRQPAGGDAFQPDGQPGRRHCRATSRARRAACACSRRARVRRDASVVDGNRSVAGVAQPCVAGLAWGARCRCNGAARSGRSTSST